MAALDRRTALVLVLLALGAGAAAAQDGVEFLDPLTNEPLDVPLPEDAGAALQQFHATGENPYVGDEAAVAAGKQLYTKWCQACHLPDATGRIGPSLVDDVWKYERTGTDQGRFEIIFAGGAGAMQAFHPRLSQDQILQVIAYIDQLRQQQQ